MKWNRFQKTFYFVLASVSLFSGCLDHQVKEEEIKGMVCNARRVCREDLINPATHNVPSSSCSKKSLKLSSLFANASPLTALEEHEQFEAQLTDIAVPVMAKAMGATKSSTGGTQLVYQSTLSLLELTTFFVQEMERLGWQEAAHFEGEELLLQFKKPGRFCTISVRPTAKGWSRSKKVELVLFIGNG